MNETKPLLGINDKPSALQWITLSLQHLFAMFGATVLVPFLIELSPAVALVSSGIGTLAFLIITQFKVPAYLGSSLLLSHQLSRRRQCRAADQAQP